VRAERLTAFAILSGGLGLLCSGPGLLSFDPLGWIAQTLYIFSAAAALGQVLMRSRRTRKLIAELQEHLAALNPGAGAPPESIEATARAIVNSAETIVARASSRAKQLELRVAELELQLRMSQTLQQATETAVRDTTASLALSDAACAFRSEQEGQIEGLRTAFVSKVSHDLRTPLSSIKAYIELLIDGEARDAVTQRQFYEIIQSEANRLGRMIDGNLPTAACPAQTAPSEASARPVSGYRT